MNKRILALCLAAVMLLLTGCQLAVDSGEAAGADRLVGMYITLDYIDLFDAERWLADNPGALHSGDEIIIDMESSTERLWAVPVEETYTDEDGVTHTNRTYAFPTVEGFMMAVFSVREEFESYHATAADEPLCDVKTQFFVTDDGEDNGISGRIYGSPDAGELFFYCNPVYQTADGSVYLIPGSGMQLSTDVSGEATQKITDTVTVTENGETRTVSFYAELIMDMLEPARSVQVLEMAADHTILRIHEIDCRKPDTELTPDGATAYLLVEEQCQTQVRRSLVSRSDEWLSVYFSEDGRLCTKQQFRVNWQ